MKQTYPQRGRHPEPTALVDKRIQAISRDDPNRGKTFRVFLESVLLAELGEILVNDPQFANLVDDIQRAMEADSSVRKSIDLAVSQLLSTHRV